MSEDQTGEAPVDERSYLEIDARAEPEAYIRDFTRTARRSAIAKQNVLSGGDYGEYEEKFINEATGERLRPEDMIVAYAQELLTQGVRPVNIVDFGAGGAATLAHAAVKMKEQIKQGDVKLIATNLGGKPTLDDIAAVPYGRERLKDLEVVLRDNLIDFQVADILELRDRMKGSPVHLMLTQNVFPFTGRFNDYLLKTLAEMLDKENGTLVIGYPGIARIDRSSDIGRKEWNTLIRGVSYIIDAGFQQKPERSIRDGTYTFFQAPHAPKFTALS